MKELAPEDSSSAAVQRSYSSVHVDVHIDGTVTCDKQLQTYKFYSAVFRSYDKM